MAKNLATQLIESHVLNPNVFNSKLIPGQELTLKVDQTLTQDSTGTMVYLQLEAMAPDYLKTELSVAYVDHNLLQSGFENADDHAFLQSIAKKYGIVYSKPGNGICHQLHLENFSKPGQVLIGSDSHTPTCGAVGMLAIGAGGLDVAIGMAAGTYTLKMPKVIEVHLTGQLQPWVTAKDIILKVLQILSVKGGVNAILEYTGEGIQQLTVPERATITNMGAELGATTSIFPSDAQTLDFLTRQGRKQDYLKLAAESGAEYDERLHIDLNQLVPMIAKPHSPDAVVAVEEITGIKVDQVAIGSCTNASYVDLMKVALLLKGKRVHPEVSLVISPGSSAILKMLGDNGALSDLIAAGARILEAGCGPCIGMGQSPKTGAVSLRTFNRNFKGRSGTQDAEVYLVSPEVAAVAALTGVITDPRTFSELPRIELPECFEHIEGFWIQHERNLESPVTMGPNIKPFPLGQPLPDQYKLKVSLKTEDHITTDDIMPSHAGLLPYRSNVPRLSQDCFVGIDEAFPTRAAALGSSLILGGHTYGQGSSREHAALVPLYLGVRVVIAKSYARIHRANLINAGILPLTYLQETDHERLSLLDEIELIHLHEGLATGQIQALAPGGVMTLVFEGSERERDILLAGGALKHALF